MARKPGKQRLDALVVDLGLAESRSQAQGLIRAGRVRVAGQVVDKPGSQIASSAEIALERPPPFVSRGGEKLEAALQRFDLDVEGLIAADVGASTGGFTDCLLQRGARRVYAIDVGYGQLDWGLRNDPRVVVMERTNARHLQSLAEPVEVVVADASFISLKLILPAAVRWLGIDGQVIALIKPQFEAGRAQVGKGGVVRDPEVHRGVLQGVLEAAGELELGLRGGLGVGPRLLGDDEEVDERGVDPLGAGGRDPVEAFVCEGLLAEGKANLGLGARLRLHRRGRRGDLLPARVGHLHRQGVVERFGGRVIGVEEQLGGRIALILDGGPCRGGVPSTILDCSVSPPQVLRHGVIGEEGLYAVMYR